MIFISRNRTFSGVPEEIFDRIYENLKEYIVLGKAPVDSPLAAVAKGESARAVPIEFHNTVVQNIVDSLNTVFESGLMSNILIFNRDKECLYDMSQTLDVNPCDILHKAIFGKERAEEHDRKPEPKPQITSLFSRAAQKNFAEAAKAKPMQQNQRSKDDIEIK